MPPQKHTITNVPASLEGLSEYWSPKILAQVNDQCVKVAKVQGEFVWHKHDQEDELFYVLKGNLEIHYPDSVVQLAAGDLHVVPRGVMHLPKASQECWIMLIEPVSTAHTGETISSRTKSLEDQQ